MDPAKIAVILIGFQNDYFSEEGVLHGAIEGPGEIDRVLKNTLHLIDRLAPTPALIVSTPISFTPDYRELADAVGILKTIREVKAFCSGTAGVEPIPELARYRDRITELSGKSGMNAFADTGLDSALQEHGVEHLVFAGAITSVCIDSTARAAVERGYKPVVLSDCTCGRTQFEQEFYCDKVFPIYSRVIDHDSLLQQLDVPREIPVSPIDEHRVDELVQQRLFEELSAAENRYRELVDNLHNIVFQHDEQGRLSYVNPAWEDTLGYSAAESLDRPLEGFLYNDESVSDLLGTRVGKPLRHQEIQLRDADGEPRWFDLSLRSSGAGGVGLLYEITAKKEEHQRLERLVRMTETATNAKSRFLATMSHEIRTPISGVLGMTELLLDTELDPTQRSYAESLRGSGQALLVIIDEILDFSKLEADKLDLHSQRVAPARIIRDVTNLLGYAAEKKSIGLDSTIDPDVPRLVMADGDRLRQVLTNLVNNAIKFTDQGGIEVTLRRAKLGKGILQFAVRDTGIGIPDDMRNQLFQSFSQLDSSRSRKHGGAGLGLAISARLVALMGGKIWVDSDGSGSTFQFTIRADPIEEDEDWVTEDSVEDSPQRDWQPLADELPLRILVAEDDPTSQFLIGNMLAKLGYEAEIVDNGYLILERLEKNVYDIVLMDVEMPDMDGVTTTQHIRSKAETEGLAVIGISAYALKEDVQRGLAEGMTDYLTKPVSLGELYRTLKRWGSSPEQNAATA